MENRNINSMIGRVVRHFKGNFYKVITISKDTDTLEEYVVYSLVSNPKKVWHRKLKEFMSENPHKDKYPSQKYRFEIAKPRRRENSPK